VRCALPVSNRHTFIIPTYNRPQLVQRLVRYYASHAPSHTLLVLDSSAPDVMEANARIIGSLGDRVRYVPFSQTLRPFLKWVRGIELVDTPFASFCADDDLIFPDAMDRSLDFLEANPDYSTAHGLYLGFRQSGEDVHLAPEYAGPGDELSSAEARIFRLLQRYESLFYGVFRTADLLDVFNAMKAIESSVFQELFQSVATVICGKVKRLPIFYGARQSGPPAEPRREKWQTHYWFADDPEELVQQYRHYCDDVWQFALRRSEGTKLERARFYRALHLAHATYFSAGCPPEHFFSALKEHWPGDAYEDVRRLDMLESLAPGREVLRCAAYWRGFAWRRVQQLSLAIGRLRLSAGGASRWKCHLPLELHWLPHNAMFRQKWRQLCRYLES
jgi:glycosyltransferase domain-containing protein